VHMWTPARCRGVAFTLVRSVASTMLGAAAAVLLASCETFPSLDRIGVSISGDDVVGHYVPCDGEMVERIELFSTPDLADTHVQVWEAKGAPGSTEFSVGRTPPGMTGTDKDEPLKADRIYRLEVETNIQKVAAVGFTPAKLQTGTIDMSDGRHLTTAEFLDAAAD
jgi:hypothetical protein